MTARSIVLGSLFAIVSFRPSPSIAAEVFAPPSHGISRYEAIWKRSPFIQETPAIPPPGLESKYGLVGLASLGADPVAFLVDRMESDPARGRFMISLNHPESRHRLEMLAVSLEPDFRRSSVRIRQGGKEAVLPWDSTIRDSLPGHPTLRK